MFGYLPLPNRRQHTVLPAWTLTLPAFLVQVFLAFVSLVPTAHADIQVPPVVCGTNCGVVTDGTIWTVEYANGTKSPLQDFATGTFDGELFLALENGRLRIGLRLPKTDQGELTLYFDSERVQTLFSGNPATLEPRGEDRRLWLEYSTVKQPYLQPKVQSRGQNGSWVDLLSGDPDAWDIDLYFSQPQLDPEFIHIEVRVDMRPSTASVSQPLDVGLLGLGIQHLANDGAVQRLPNDPNSMLHDELTATWETLDFSFPDSIPLSVGSWNIGQMPAAALVIGDGGSGEPPDFAPHIAFKDVVCLSEVWDNADAEALLAEVNIRRGFLGLGPMRAIGLATDDEGGQDTGLLLLSARPFIDHLVLEYDPDFCGGWDCEQDKGVIWGRVLLSGGEPVPGPRPRPGNADHFIDVYCTHTQADDDEFSNRGVQLAELKSFIDKTRAPDRPAILMGDLNVVADRPTEPPSIEYASLLNTLDVASLTPFDAANTWLSDLYDLGTLPQVGDPTAELTGTSLSGINCSFTILADQLGRRRLDYIFVLPAPDLWPAWGIEQMPSYTVEPAFEPLLSHTECLSDHTLIEADLGLVQTEQPGKWNPAKPHLMTLRTLELVDHAGGGCCADWFTKELRIDTSESSFTDEETDDGDIVNPGWTVSHLMAGADFDDMEVEVWEADWPSSDDHYDSSDHGKDARFDFDHFTGVWREIDWQLIPMHFIGSFSNFPGGMVWTTTGDSNSKPNATAVHQLTAEEQ